MNLPFQFYLDKFNYNYLFSSHRHLQEIILKTRSNKICRQVNLDTINDTTNSH